MFEKSEKFNCSIFVQVGLIIAWFATPFQLLAISNTLQLEANHLSMIHLKDYFGKENNSKPNRSKTGPLRENRILQKTVLITGAAKGLGEQLAQEASKYNPAKVILHGRNLERLLDVQEDLEQKFPAIEYESIVADLRETRKPIREKLDEVDLLILNAGVSKRKTWGQLHILDLMEAIEVNFQANLELILDFKHLGKKQIILISSAMKDFNLPEQFLHYIISKLGLSEAAFALPDMDIFLAHLGILTGTASASQFDLWGNSVSKLSGEKVKDAAVKILDNFNSGKKNIEPDIKTRIAVAVSKNLPVNADVAISKSFNYVEGKIEREKSSSSVFWQILNRALWENFKDTSCYLSKSFSKDYKCSRAKALGGKVLITGSGLQTDRIITDTFADVENPNQEIRIYGFKEEDFDDLNPKIALLPDYLGTEILEKLNPNAIVFQSDLFSDSPKSQFLTAMNRLKAYLSVIHFYRHEIISGNIPIILIENILPVHILPVQRSIQSIMAGILRSLEKAYPSMDVFFAKILTRAQYDRQGKMKALMTEPMLKMQGIKEAFLKGETSYGPSNAKIREIENAPLKSFNFYGP